MFLLEGNGGLRAHAETWAGSWQGARVYVRYESVCSPAADAQTQALTQAPTQAPAHAPAQAPAQAPAHAPYTRSDTR